MSFDVHIEHNGYLPGHDVRAYVWGKLSSLLDANEVLTSFSHNTVSMTDSLMGRYQLYAYGVSEGVVMAAQMALSDECTLVQCTEVKND